MLCCFCDRKKNDRKKENKSLQEMHAVWNDTLTDYLACDDFQQKQQYLRQLNTCNTEIIKKLSQNLQQSSDEVQNFL